MKKPIEKIIADTAQKLLAQSENADGATAESWWLLEYLTGETQGVLIQKREFMLSHEQEQRLESWIKDRIEHHKPLQYILGTVPFCNLEILVKPPTLIPRQETEEWCDWLIKQLAPIKEERITILDLGVGSGCIALALAKAFPYATVIGVDIHPEAIALSEKNKVHNKIANAIFLRSNLYNELSAYKGAIDLIVSNPPYISPQEFATLSKQVSEWEDKDALVAHDDGFAIHKQIIQGAKLYLKKESVLQTKNLPRLLLEFGKGQEATLQALFQDAGFHAVKTHKDTQQVYRWITAML